MIYLDSCAITKLVIREAESAELATFIADHGDQGDFVISSELSIVEVRRALIRNNLGEDEHRRADQLLEGYARLPIAPVLASAAHLPGQHLRSLDAVHLATAQQLGAAVTLFVSYDKRLLAHAKKIGMPVASPGQPE